MESGCGGKYRRSQKFAMHFPTPLRRTLNPWGTGHRQLLIAKGWDISGTMLVGKHLVSLLQNQKHSMKCLFTLKQRPDLKIFIWSSIWITFRWKEKWKYIYTKTFECWIKFQNFNRYYKNFKLYGYLGKIPTPPIWCRQPSLSVFNCIQNRPGTKIVLALFTTFPGLAKSLTLLPETLVFDL